MALVPAPVLRASAEKPARAEHVSHAVRARARPLQGLRRGELTASGSLPVSLAAITVHTLAMLAVTGAIAVTVYEWLGVGVLRRGWVNVDVVWILALIGAGAFLFLG